MKTIGKFKICGLLGQGGMGKVYKIAYPITGKIAAMKILAPNPILVSLLGKKAIDDIFIREAVTMAGIRHPNITEILDFDSIDGTYYYIMDFHCNNLGSMIGESYETEKPTRRISLDKAISYTRQVLSGLSRLHFASLIHRDIKPYNILVTDDDQVKICDFGLSKLRNESFRTHESLKIGSPYYAPPEQETNPDSVDFSCDLYATGIMLYRMVTGMLPEPPFKRPSLLNPDLDLTWDRFILTATEPDPRNRYADADAMLKDLDELEASWTKRKQSICAAPDWIFDDDEKPVEKIRLRSKGAKVHKKNAEILFETDSLMRPRRYTVNQFETRDEKTVRDKTTGLVWQISGTRYPVTRFQARDYVEQLNKESFAGISSWRLPTVNELLSLVRKSPEGKDYCLESVFDPNQKWLWSSDRCTYITAWYVNIQLGYAGFNDFDSHYHVKAVTDQGG